MSDSQQQGSPSSSPRNPNIPVPRTLPYIYILRPPEGKYSRKTDERCFIYCSQNVVGRLNARPPWCRSICIRRVFFHEVHKVVSIHRDRIAGKYEVTQTHIPLPPEGQKASAFFSQSGQEDAASGPKETRHWDEGWYLWYSKSPWAATEKVRIMELDLEGQTGWQAWKEEAHAKWLRNEPLEVVRPPMKEPPFPDITSESLLMPITRPTLDPLWDRMGKLLAPTHKVLQIFSESISSGAQKELAERVWEKARSPDPWILARNVCSKMWEKFKDGSDDDDDDPPKAL